jgi:hypothetical protein
LVEMNSSDAMKHPLERSECEKGNAFACDLGARGHEGKP